MEQIDFDYTQPTNQKWLEIMKEKLLTAQSFEIHCWSEELHWIETALRYGKLKQIDWSYGKVIYGELTPEFVDMLLNMPKPTDTEAYNKMTPFFSIFLDNGFSSEHYGTELHQM